MKSFLNPKSSNQHHPKKINSIETELRNYNSFQVETSDFSSFWCNNSEKLPLLSKLVQYICCGPPTTTPSERDFSMGTDIITPKRNKLSDRRIEILSFLKRNLDSEFKI